MVSPLYLIAMLLGAAFLHPLIQNRSKLAGQLVVLVVLGATVAIPLQWLMALDIATMQAVVFQTAGFTAPLSINLQVGVEESLFLVIIHRKQHVVISVVVVFCKHSSSLFFYFT